MTSEGRGEAGRESLISWFFFFFCKVVTSIPSLRLTVGLICAKRFISHQKCFFGTCSVKVISSVNKNSSAYLLSQWLQNAVKTTTFPSEMQKWKSPRRWDMQPKTLAIQWRGHGEINLWIRLVSISLSIADTYDSQLIPGKVSWSVSVSVSDGLALRLYTCGIAS